MPRMRPKNRSSLRAQVRTAFTLVELLVVISIIAAASAVSFPMLSSITREVRLNGAMVRVTAGIQQANAILADYPLVDRDLTAPRIPGGVFTGTALVVRWVDARAEYEMAYAICNQTAKGGGGPTDYLAGRATPVRGYSPLNTLEPITVGNGVKVAGLRRNNATPSQLELLPGASFAICVGAEGTMIPPAQTVVVNLQKPPVTGGDGPWDVWDTALYDAPDSTTGAHASKYVEPRRGSMAGNAGEAFLTALPLVVFYQDDNLPLTGNAPSGVPWRITNSDGVQVVNPALDVNELLAQTRGHLVAFSLQGSSFNSY